MNITSEKANMHLYKLQKHKPISRIQQDDILLKNELIQQRVEVSLNFGKE